jgi:hypothetical protein
MVPQFKKGFTMPINLEIEDYESVLILADDENGNLVWEVLMPEIDENVDSEGVSIPTLMCAAVATRMKEDKGFVDDMINWFDCFVCTEPPPVKGRMKTSLRRVK